MTMSTEQGTRIWDLTIIVGFVVALSTATDIAGFLRFAPSVGLPAWVAVLCVIPVKLIEWRFLTFTTRLWRQGWLGKLQSPIYLFIWGIAVSLSALAAHSATYTLLATTDYSAAKHVETRVNLVAARDRNNERLDAFAKPLPRPMNTVEKDLDWANSVLRPALDCTRSPDEGSRACRRVVELRREMAAATDYERLIREEQELREKLAGLKIETANDAMPKAYEATIGRLTEMDGKNGIALMVTLILGLVSAFGPFGLDTLRERQVTSARPEPARDGEPALDLVRGRPEGAHVIPFPSAQRGPETCPTSPIASGSCEPAQMPTGGGLGQTCKPAQEPAQGPAQAPPKDNVVQLAHRPPKGRAAPDEAAAAVRAFVGMLELGKHARSTGSELACTFAVQRLVHGWPALPPNILGIHLRTAVEELGGRKFKSGGQVYEGVRLPAAWRGPLSRIA